jgi:DNA-binding transcriptional LysR family regulator
VSTSVDTAEIEVFLTLAEELHFGRTAERLRLPQPQVSRLIARLERRVGGKLFDRTSRRVSLTRLGEQLRSELQPAHAQLNSALDNARAASIGVTGLLRIGFTVTVPSEPLARLVQAFETAHRDCRVSLVEHLVAEDDWDVWRPLREGDSDVLVYMNITKESDLTAGPVLAWLDRVLLVARGHRLAARESVSVEELACEHTMQRPPTFPSSIMDTLIPPFTPSGRPVPRTEPVRSIHEIMSLVAQGWIVHATGAGIVPARRDDIVPVPISDLPPISIGLIWCTAHENARIRALAAVARQLRPHRPSGPAPGPVGNGVPRAARPVTA